MYGTFAATCLCLPLAVNTSTSRSLVTPLLRAALHSFNMRSSVLASAALLASAFAAPLARRQSGLTQVTNFADSNPTGTEMFIYGRCTVFFGPSDHVLTSDEFSTVQSSIKASDYRGNPLLYGHRAGILFRISLCEPGRSVRLHRHLPSIAVLRHMLGRRFAGRSYPQWRRRQRSYCQHGYLHPRQVLWRLEPGLRHRL
jgi:hypothetical protein